MSNILWKCFFDENFLRPMRNFSSGFYFPVEKEFLFQTFSECQHKIEWKDFCKKCFTEKKQLTEITEEIEKILNKEESFKEKNIKCFCQKDEKRRKETENILLTITKDLEKFSVKKIMPMCSHQFFYLKLGKYTKESFYLQFRESFFFFVCLKFLTQKKKEKCYMCSISFKIFDILNNFLKLVEKSFLEIWEIKILENENLRESDIFSDLKSQCLIHYIFTLKTFLQLVWSNCQMEKDEIENEIYIPLTFFEQFKNIFLTNSISLKRFPNKIPKIENEFINKYFENSQRIRGNFSEIQITFP